MAGNLYFDGSAFHCIASADAPYAIFVEDKYVSDVFNRIERCKNSKVIVINNMKFDVYT